MIKFPLYNSISKNLPKKDLSVKEKEDCIEKINMLDEDGKEMLYALIYCYEKDSFNKLQQNTQNTQIPFDGVILRGNIDSNCDIMWNIKDFPQPLKQIIHIFVSRHCEKMIHDDYRLKNHTDVKE